jgi:phage I-like protein
MTVNAKHLQDMMDDYQLAGRDILFDVDHKSLGCFDSDSRAAGWGKAMRIEDGKLFVEMEPTEYGKALIQNGEYRYLSPVYQTERLDRVSGKTIKTWRLHSVALTNTPFLTELPAIKNHENGGTQMDEILKALGVDTENAALAKINETISQNSDLAAKLATSEGSLSAANAKLNAQEVEMAIANKQILPAQKELATKLINSDRSAYDMFVASAPKVDLTTETNVNPDPANTGNPLDKVQSFSDLLKDDALDAKFRAERPDQYAKMFENYMKEAL